ncbi:hypothetical protein B0T16DRAFT_190532 [Cercophora newfieldiana]|uniref:DUF4238 domain-containing protein n=1 Tax=Cercophora newfieldiana TaxID=92897 RepID=A0AA39Y0S3_9PEZI|nr:hypothetical protein B0T16DRAFT_190532 [Cercophora newfieldiana]
MGTATKPEYQHFVPQFLLRNFAHPYKPAGPRKRGKRKDENGIYFNELVVRNVDLTQDPPVICEKPVKRILGEMDMYDDDHPATATAAAAATAPESSKPSQTERNLEKMLGQLESKASAVFQKITKAYKEDVKDKAEGTDFGPASVELTRGERDLIRKFLFILKYRGMRFRKRFYHATAETYDDDDRELLLEYMAERGYAKPLDVWHDNIKAIIDVEMDTEGRWVKELPKRMYHMDAQWFISHTEFYYMAICTPSSPDEEFILTDNSYNIFEGPNTFVKDGNTGPVQPFYHTPLHMFAPVSPNLMIVLRAMTFPNPLEDTDKAVLEYRRLVRKVVLDDVYGPGMARSLLEDLPVAKAQNSYCRFVNNQFEWIGDKIPGRRKDDKFYFTIFPLPSKHVNTINTILLDNASYCSSVVFNDTAAFTKTLEWFLAAPCFMAKTVTGWDKDVRGKLFDKLETLSRSLGSKQKMLRGFLEAPVGYNFTGFLKWNAQKHRLIKKLMQDTGDSESILKELDDLMNPKTEFQKIYHSLGGSEDSMLYDFDQAQRMWTLRVKIDSWSRGVDESIRQRNRNILEEAYLRVSPARYFVFAKVSRIKIAAAELSKGKEYPVDVVGPEDIIAQARHIIPEPENFNRLIHNAMRGYQLINRGMWRKDTWDNMTPNVSGFMKIFTIQMMVDAPGSICDCGIPEVEHLARLAHLHVLNADLHSRYAEGPNVMALLEDDQQIELLTRSFVRKAFADASKGEASEPLVGGLVASLKEKMGDASVNRLEVVIFDFAYPTPPSDWYHKGGKGSVSLRMVWIFVLGPLLWLIGFMWLTFTKARQGMRGSVNLRSRGRA